MPDRRRSVAPSPPTARDQRREAGQRLKRALHVARARAGLTSDMAVVMKAGVGYDTLMNWFGGRTTPRPYELRKVAEALGASYGTLWGAYEGVDPEPPPLQDAIRELVGSIDDLVSELRLTRAEQLVSQEQMAEALRLADGLTRGGTAPRRRARPAMER